MKVEVEVISREIVKPSSPTPQHLRRYHLSFLDQMCPQIFNSMVYFFVADASNPMNINDASNRLKKSLSQVLTHYYPLAGRLIDKKLIDCNDEGVPYLEARVRCHLSRVIGNPTPADNNKLLPFEMDEAFDTVLGVQFNVFDCGGIAIGACISHKVADALSYFQFINSWAAMTRGEPEKIRTHFQSSTLFPPKDMSGYDPNASIAKDNIVTKRFAFEASAIESLRAKYSEKTNVLEGQKPPSRVDVLSTFVWTRFMVATNQVGSKKIYFVAHTANLRPRMDPPLPDYAFGNFFWAAITFPSFDEKGECYDLAKQLREQLNKIDNDYIVKLREAEQWKRPHIEAMDRSSAMGEMVQFTFTALCRFPVYEVDFGWGNPTWAGPPTWKFKNVVVFKDTKSGGGIEAYVCLTEEDMAKFERDEEFLAHVSTTGLI